MIDCTRNKNLQPGDKITFIKSNMAYDGTIQEKTNLDKGDIDFLIELTDGSKTRIKHRYLDLLV